MEELAVRIPENRGDDNKQFSWEARDYLLGKRKLTIYSLSDKSIEELEKESGIELKRTEVIEQKYPDFRNQRSIRRDVAINPNEFFLEESVNNQSYKQIERVISNYSNSFSTRVPGVRAIMGTVADYFALYVMLKETGKDLFRTENDHGVFIAKFPPDESTLAVMKKSLANNDSVIVMIEPRDLIIYPQMMASPLIVPNS